MANHSRIRTIINSSILINCRGFLLLLLIFIWGCATAIQYAPIIKYGSNSNNCPADKVCIYVIRPASFVGSVLHFVVSDNNTEIGVTGPDSYLAWQRDPGTVNLESKAENIDNYNFIAKAGQSYYVLQSVEPGIISGRNIIRPISKDEAEVYLKKCHPAGN